MIGFRVLLSDPRILCILHGKLCRCRWVEVSVPCGELLVCPVLLVDLKLVFAGSPSHGCGCVNASAHHKLFPVKHVDYLFQSSINVTLSLKANSGRIVE